jgi:hypothetical protein
MQTLKKIWKQNGLSSFLSAEKKKQAIFRKSLGKEPGCPVVLILKR